MQDIHNYKRRLERTYNSVINSTAISKENKELIQKFHDNCFTESLSLSKIERYLYDIKAFALMLNKPFLDASREDIKAIVAQIEKKEWSPHTKHGFKIAIRKFYKSIEGSDEKGVYPERIRWLHSNVKVSQGKSPADLITEKEIKKMIACCNNARNKALIAVLFESGCRISELGLIKIKDVTFDQYGAVVGVTGKTGPRNVRIVMSAYYLKDYLNKHENNQDPQSYIWVKRSDSKLLCYSRLAEVIKRAANRAGIKKRVHPHLFRHTRATLLAKRLTEAQMKSYLGWTRSSKMAGIYVHLSGKDTDEAILEMNGVKIKKEESEEELKPRKCIRCNLDYGATTKFCEQCGLVLDEEEAQKTIRAELDRQRADEIMNKAFQNTEFLKIIENLSKQV